MTISNTVKEGDLQAFPSMYRTVVILKAQLCVTRTEHSYRPSTLPLHVQYMDVMSSFITNGRTELSTLTDINYLQCLQSSVKSLLKDAESPVFTAPLVTFSAPSPVKIGHVTYKMENVWNVNLGYMAVTVIYRVPPTVKTIRVTHGMEHVIHVNLDGQEYTVKQNVLRGGTVSTVAKHAHDIVEAALYVIT